MRPWILPLLSMLIMLPLVATVVVQSAGQERQRADIPDQFKWNLGDIFPSLEAWRGAKAKAAAEVPALGAQPAAARRLGVDGAVEVTVDTAELDELTARAKRALAKQFGRRPVEKDEEPNASH